MRTCSQRRGRHARAPRRAPRARDDRRRARDPAARGRRPRRASHEGTHVEFGACPPSASSWPQPARTAARRRRASACWPRSASAGCGSGFLKPVGQRYLVVDGTRADEDAVLMSGLRPARRARRHVAGHPAAPLHHRLRDGPRRRRPRRAGARPSPLAAADKDVVVVEGTGHAGRRGRRALERACRRDARRAGHHRREGGIGRPIDEIVLNGALRGARRRVIGAVVNKVDVESHPDLPSARTRPRPARRRALACIPYSVPRQPVARADRHPPRRGSSSPAMRRPGRTIGRSPSARCRRDHAVELLRDRTLLIAGDQEDLVLAAIEGAGRPFGRHRAHRWLPPGPTVLDAFATPGSSPTSCGPIRTAPPRPSTRSSSRRTRRTPRRSRRSSSSWTARSTSTLLARL